MCSLAVVRSSWPACVQLRASPLSSHPTSRRRSRNLTGQVSVLKDSTPWALQVGSVVQVRQVILTGADGFAIFQVSDGSTFEVYPNSRVVFRANPSNLKDLLDLVLDV